MTLTEPMFEVVVSGWDQEKTLSRVSWCSDYIGTYGRGWKYYWNDSHDSSIWSFTNKEHATIFALKFA
jgi:hypothetical protein